MKDGEYFYIDKKEKISKLSEMLAFYYPPPPPPWLLNPRINTALLSKGLIIQNKNMAAVSVDLDRLTS